MYFKSEQRNLHKKESYFYLKYHQRNVRFYIFIYRVIKKTWFSVLEGHPVKINKQKLYDVFLCMNTHFFSFYKPNSIFKTIGAFCGKSF